MIEGLGQVALTVSNMERSVAFYRDVVGLRFLFAPAPTLAFLAIGDGAQRWLAEAAASGAARIRSKMARAVELAAVVGAAQVDAALGLAAIAGRFADADLASILDHLAAEREIGEVVIADETHSAQPGTGGWARLGTEAGR